MNIKKSTIILYGLLAIAVVVAINGKFKEQKLKKQLNDIKVKEVAISKDKALQNELIKIDSLLIRGNYKSALNAYKKQANANNPYAKLRIELTKHFIQLNKARKTQDSLEVNEKEIDSNAIKSIVTSYEIRKYDSLNFAIEKLKTQLKRIKKQQQSKSYGEYLRFTNRKQHKVHYVGQVKNNKANGNGIAFFDTGSRYEGEWVNNLRHGEGTFYWNDGQYYVGQYKNDKRSGKGTYYWPNGEKYVGQWESDHQNGEGVFYDKDGNIITKGVWKNDKLVEQIKTN